MKDQNTLASSTFKELTSFLAELNGSRFSGRPVLRKSLEPKLIVSHLERQLPKEEVPTIFRRLGRHRQLSFAF
jgi:hypothetical protein